MSESTTIVDPCECAVSRAAANPASPTTVMKNSTLAKKRGPAQYSFKTQSLPKARRTKSPLSTPAIKKYASRTSGNTPCRGKKIGKCSAYRKFHGDRQVAAAMERVSKCFLCGIDFSLLGDRKITEHDHHTGDFRGTTCQSCNSTDGWAVRFARHTHGVKKEDYEAGKPMPRGFFDTYAKNLSSSLRIDPDVCREYITGERWLRFKNFF